MKDDHGKIFRLIETADNFVKYARPGRERRALARARKRYQKALETAEAWGDAEMIEQVRLRIGDLAALAPASTTADVGEAPSEPPAPGADAMVGDERVPPGQSLIRGWPVLHVGPIPRFESDRWRLAADGACSHPLELDYGQLKALPNVERRADFHCVTGWSRLDNLWRGVPTKVLMEMVVPDPDAAYVVVHADHGYTANVPLDVLMENKALLAWQHDDKPLTPAHGFPLRLVIPSLYAWKSVKWVRRLELVTADRRGFWETRGYHNHADPWLEERYSYQEA